MKSLFKNMLLVLAAITTTFGFTSCDNDDDPVDPKPTMVTYSLSTTSISFNSAEAVTALGQKLTTYFNDNLCQYATVTNNTTTNFVSITLLAKDSYVETIDDILSQMQSDTKKLDEIITGIDGINTCSLVITCKGKTVYTYEYKTTYCPTGVWVGQTAAGDSALVWIGEKASNDSAYEAYVAIGENISYEGKVEALGKAFLFSSNETKEGSEDAVLEVYLPITNETTFTGKIDGCGYSVEKVNFTKMDVPNNMYFTLSCKVSDPDNELQALGLTVDSLQASLPETKTVDLGTKTGKQIGNMLVATADYCMGISNAMDDQIKAHPELSKTNVNIEVYGIMANVKSGIKATSQKVYYKDTKSE